MKEVWPASFKYLSDTSGQTAIQQLAGFMSGMIDDMICKQAGLKDSSLQGSNILIYPGDRHWAASMGQTGALHQDIRSRMAEAKQLGEKRNATKKGNKTGCLGHNVWYLKPKTVILPTISRFISNESLSVKAIRVFRRLMSLYMDYPCSSRLRPRILASDSVPVWGWKGGKTHLTSFFLGFQNKSSFLAAKLKVTRWRHSVQRQFRTSKLLTSQLPGRNWCLPFDSLELGTQPTLSSLGFNHFRWKRWKTGQKMRFCLAGSSTSESLRDVCTPGTFRSVSF